MSHKLDTWPLGLHAEESRVPVPLRIAVVLHADERGCVFRTVGTER